jgi:3-oxoacyl-[acyl-carrier protein] reductase
MSGGPVKNISVAIVTGASQGIGRATASRLARDFSAVVLAARNNDDLQKTAAIIDAAGAESLVCALDLREPRSAEILVNSTLDRFGRIDALLNIAGAVPQIDLFEMTDGQWEDGIALKLHGARRLTMRAWNALKASNGSVVLISGSAALDPKPAFAAVPAINAAIIALAKVFAEQGIKDDVQVNSVVPGAVLTGRRQSFFEKWAPAHHLTVEEAMKKFPEEAGIARFGKPEEIADLMAYLVSPAAKWNRVIRADGRRRNQGYLMRSPSGATSTARRFPRRMYGSAKGNRRAVGGVFRRSVRRYHHNHGPGPEAAGASQVRSPFAFVADRAELRGELHVHCNCLAQSSSPPALY